MLYLVETWFYNGNGSMEMVFETLEEAKTHCVEIHQFCEKLVPVVQSRNNRIWELMAGKQPKRVLRFEDGQFTTEACSE